MENVGVTFLKKGFNRFSVVLCVYFNMSNNILQNLWSKTLLKDTPVRNRETEQEFHWNS